MDEDDTSRGDGPSFFDELQTAWGCWGGRQGAASRGGDVRPLGTPGALSRERTSPDMQWIGSQMSRMAPADAAGSAALKGKDSLSLLRGHIAKNPENFFATAQAQQDGILTLREWEAVCTRVLGHEEPELVRELFDQMDLDKDGTVSREEFIEMRNAIRLFLTGANTQGLMVEMLVGAVTAHLAKTPQPQDDDTSVADKTFRALVSLKAAEMHESMVALPKALSKHAEQVRREREHRDKALTQLQLDEGEGKFANLPTAAYGTKDDFHKGLEVRRNGRDT